MLLQQVIWKRANGFRKHSAVSVSLLVAGMCEHPLVAA